MPTVEQRLARYRAVLDDPPAVDLAVAEAAPTTAPRRRATGVTVAACALLIGLMVWGRASITPPAAEPAPPWYQAIEPFLPDGYEQAAIQRATDTLTDVVAFDTDDATMLSIRKSRVAIAPDPSGERLWTDEHGTWFEFPGGFNLVGNDGMQVQVDCRRFTMDGDLETSACSPANGFGLDADELRELTISVSTDFDPTVVPVAGPPDHPVPTADIVAALDDVLNPLVPAWPPLESTEIRSRGFGYSTGMLPIEPLVTVYTLDPFYPGTASRPLTGDAETAGTTSRWVIDAHDALWVVSTDKPEQYDVGAVADAVTNLQPTA